jgi:hypothetical protein
MPPVSLRVRVTVLGQYRTEVTVPTGNHPSIPGVPVKAVTPL